MTLIETTALLVYFRSQLGEKNAKNGAMLPFAGERSMSGIWQHFIFSFNCNGRDYRGDQTPCYPTLCKLHVSSAEGVTE